MTATPPSPSRSRSSAPSAPPIPSPPRTTATTQSRYPAPPRMPARPHPLVGPLVLVTLCLTPTTTQADTAELTPCVGRWEGMGKDPWLDDPPYAIELDLMDGARQCATVTYVGQCTARWVDCTVAGRWVHATEELVDPGTCAVGRVTLRCVDPTTLALRWEGEPGVMEATLHRVGPPAPRAEPTVAPREPPTPTPAEARELEEPPRGCGCTMAFVIPLVGLRRRRLSTACRPCA